MKLAGLSYWVSIVVWLLLPLVMHAAPPREYTVTFARDGELNGSEAGAGLGKWDAAPEFICQSGALKVTSGTGKKLSARFPMPSLENAGRLTVRVVLQAANVGEEGIAIGFTSKATADPFLAGALLTVVRGDCHAVAFFSGGDFRSGELAGVKGALIEPQWFSKLYRTNESATEVLLTYDLKKGTIRLELSQGNHKMAMLDDVPVAWQGSADTPIPVDVLEYFTIFFAGQNGVDDGLEPVASVTSVDLEID